MCCSLHSPENGTWSRPRFESPADRCIPKLAAASPRVFCISHAGPASRPWKSRSLGVNPKALEPRNGHLAKIAWNLCPRWVTRDFREHRNHRSNKRLTCPKRHSCPLRHQIHPQFVASSSVPGHPSWLVASEKPFVGWCNWKSVRSASMTDGI